MNEAFAVAEQTFCRKCAEQFLAEHQDIAKKPGAIARLSDPSVCGECGADAGESEHSLLAGVPICGTCEDRFRNRPFPTWLKASAAVFLCVAVGAFIYNLRFFLAYVELNRAQRELESGDMAQAAVLFESAAQRLPEIRELSGVANVYKAEHLLATDQCEQAIGVLKSASQDAPPPLQPVIHELELYAEGGIAFNRHDYDTFVDRSRQVMELHPESATAVAALASAYACKYAATGDKSFYDDSLKYLEQARGLEGGGSKEARNYETRIRHRLQTREVITKDEYQKRFPNGWQPEAGT